MWQAGAPLHCSSQASHCAGFSCCRAHALGMWASVVAAHRLSCPVACGIFPNQQWNLWPLHRQILFFFSFSHRLYYLNIIILYTNVNFLQNSIFHIARSLHSPFYATFPSRGISPNHSLSDCMFIVVVQLLSCV